MVACHLSNNEGINQDSTREFSSIFGINSKRIIGILDNNQDLKKSKELLRLKKLTKSLKKPYTAINNNS